MTCDRCHRALDPKEPICPYCGAANRDASGVFQTSAVLIAAGGSQRFYHSKDEVPSRLRTRLEKSTNGLNSATIVIADRGGRRQIARVLRSLPGAAQQRLVRAVAGSYGIPGSPRWLTPRRKVAIGALIGALTAALVAVVFAFHWQ